MQLNKEYIIKATNVANIYKDFFEQIDLTFKYYRCNIYE